MLLVFMVLLSEFSSHSGFRTRAHRGLWMLLLTVASCRRDDNTISDKELASTYNVALLLLCCSFRVGQPPPLTARKKRTGERGQGRSGGRLHSLTMSPTVLFWHFLCLFHAQYVMFGTCSARLSPEGGELGGLFPFDELVSQHLISENTVSEIET